MLLLLAAVYLGWTLGANNTANVFGAVMEGSKVVDTIRRFMTLHVFTELRVPFSNSEVIGIPTRLES